MLQSIHGLNIKFFSNCPSISTTGSLDNQFKCSNHMNGLVLDKDSDVLIGVMNGNESCFSGGILALRISSQVSL